MEILNSKEEQKLESIDEDSSETQYQRRDTALTDREILELATNELAIGNLLNLKYIQFLSKYRLKTKNAHK